MSACPRLFPCLTMSGFSFQFRARLVAIIPSTIKLRDKKYEIIQYSSMLLSVFILISVLTTQSFSSNVSLELHLYPDAEENKLQCNDGSPGGYYLRPAPEDAEDGARDRWIFYLEGGGWCWNVTQCFIRIVYNHGRKICQLTCTMTKLS